MKCLLFLSDFNRSPKARTLFLNISNVNVLVNPSSGRQVLIDANRQTADSNLTFARRICSVNASKKQSWAAEKWSPFKLTILSGINTLGNVAQGYAYWNKSVNDVV